MGIINSGIKSIAEERARTTAKIERIYSEVTEAAADESVMDASMEVVKESAVDDIDLEELDALLRELPADAEDEREEIARILAVEDDDIDIDDIVGVSLNAE